MWFYENVVYQIYPLGMTGAPFENDGILTHRMQRLMDYIPHMERLGIRTVYFSPVFESDSHGYNTRDYRKIDVRLGTNADFKALCEALHKKNIRILLDGVFNHVGRGFFAFLDVLKNREQSAYKNWFYVDFNGNSPYNDGLSYEGWEGCMDLVKLNISNPEVTDYLLESIHTWIEEFDIDGLRLDVAYMVDPRFLESIRTKTAEWKKDFVLLGEILGGDYNRIMNDSMCHSVTNYECYKGLYSSMNSHNLFEILHSLLRQFGPEEWCLYRGKHLLSFVDNHDVTRIASILTDEKHLPLIYSLMFAMPGIPQIYYGSEWGCRGDKKEGDQALRPEVKEAGWTPLTEHIQKLVALFQNNPILQYGDFTSLALTNNQCAFERKIKDKKMIFVLNIDQNEYFLPFSIPEKKAKDMLTEEEIMLQGGLLLPPYFARFLYLE